MALSFAAIMAKKLRVTFAMDCCDRKPWTGPPAPGGYDSDTVQDVMLRAVERRFGDALPASPVEWLTDNGSVYRAHETRAFARNRVGARTTAVRSTEQRYRGELREDDEARLYRDDAGSRIAEQR